MAVCVQDSSDNLYLKMEGMESNTKTCPPSLDCSAIKDEPKERELHIHEENKTSFNNDHVNNPLFEVVSSVDSPDNQSGWEITSNHQNNAKSCHLSLDCSAIKKEPKEWGIYVPEENNLSLLNDEQFNNPHCGSIPSVDSQDDCSEGKLIITQNQVSIFTIGDHAVFSSLPIEPNKVCSSTDQTESSYSCFLCDNSFSNLNTLEQHLLVHRGTKPSFDCEQDKFSSTDVGLKTHSFTELQFDNGSHTAGDTKPISVVEIIPDGQLSSFTIGEDAGFSRLPIQNKVCPSTKKSESSYDCSLCENSFSNLNSLEQHLLVHCSAELSVDCEQDKVCSPGVDINTDSLSISEKSFPQKSNIKSHSCNYSDEKSYDCTVCGKLFTRKHSLNRHMFIHSDEKPHTCSVCGKGFSQKIQLQQHSLIHSGKEKFICAVCDKSFTKKGILNSHMLIHSGENPHVCTLCGKAFSRKEHLKKHLLIHTGKKSHVCTVCDKSFIQNRDLKRHMLIHSGEKPHACTVCDQSYSRKDSLKIHMMMHSGEEPHACDVCNKSFTRKGTLMRHMLIHSA